VVQHIINQRIFSLQFSSDIIYPLELNSFDDYTNPSSRKALMDGINAELSTLTFLGEGSFLNKGISPFYII